MDNDTYEAPKIVFEGDLEVQAGSTIPSGELTDQLFGEWD